MSEKTVHPGINGLLVSTMQRLAEVRADPALPDSLERLVASALQTLGEAFALSRSRAAQPQQKASLYSLRLDQVFIENEHLFSTTLGNSDLDLVCETSRAIPCVEVTRGQLEYIFLTSLLACRTLAGGNRPMTVTLGTTELQADEENLSRALAPGRYATITVSCSSHLVDDCMEPGPFDNIPATPEEAETIALGLGCVQRIVASLGGCLRVDAARSHSPVVVLFLPQAPLPEKNEAEMPFAAGGHDGETVLLVDDDPMVRRYTRRALETAGLRVLEAADSREAMSILHDREDQVDLVIADLVLPDMHGGRLARAIQQEFGSLPVIFVSGYDNRAIQHHGLIEQGAKLLRKPYTRRSLLTMIDSALQN